MPHVYKPIWEYDARTLGEELSADLVFGTATGAVSLPSPGRNHDQCKPRF